MRRAVSLTTTDNPFNPVHQFDDWYRFDMDHNYDCCSKLARVAYCGDFVPDIENDIEIERAIDDIVGLGLGFLDRDNNIVRFKKVVTEIEDDE